MSEPKDRLGSLENFAQLDLSELYHLGDRRAVERGLCYFRDYAVDSLSWDGRSKRITALVSGGRYMPYDVRLWLKRGKVRHECECPAWENYGACKHGVAALAAVFAALQGFQPSSQTVPEDYLSTLRSGLGLKPGGRLPEENKAPDASRPVAVFKIIDFHGYGGMRLRGVGPMPYSLLKAVGLHPSGEYTGGQSREVFIGNVAQTFESFLKKAKKAGVVVKARTSEAEVELRLSKKRCQGRIEYDLVGREVLRRVVLSLGAGSALDVEECFAGRFALLSDGTVYLIENADQIAGLGSGSSLLQRFSPEAFNQAALALGVSREGNDWDNARFLISGQPVVPELCQSDGASLSVCCSIHENAAREPERLDFRCSAETEACSVDLAFLQQQFLSALLHASGGGLLSAKRRVNALLDLIRRFLSDYAAGREFEPSAHDEDFAEIMKDEFRYSVLLALKNLKELLRESGQGAAFIAVDPTPGSFRLYSVDRIKLAMLLFSMSSVDTRRGLHQLQEGSLAIRRGSSGRDVLNRLLVAAQTLGVSVKVDDLPVRSERLSISVDAKTAGTDIDWFALHPSIACGERTIKPDEWRDLIRGELLLRGEDGALIMPEVAGEGEADGLRALASLLRVDQTSRLGSGDGAARISRLKMLDWIALRRHGIRVDLPPEAEAVFESLLRLKRLPDFEPPAGCTAKLRGYQKAGCAWIDFLFKHRFGACLADDMGLGKTVQTIAFIVACIERRSITGKGAQVLIVLPPSLVFNWLDEWQRFAPGVKVTDCLRKSDWKGALDGAEVVLTTYDRIRLDSKELSERSFEIVVFDEAHSLKNITAARTRAATRLKRRFSLCLTGTPVENNASEFYSVLTAAVPGIFGTHKDFQEAFRKRPDQILGRARPFILRRTKKSILKDLPAKEEHVLHLEMTALQKEIYTRTVAEVREEIAEAFADKPEQQAGIVALAAILRLRQVCVSPALLGKKMPEIAPKFAYMADKLEELKAEGHAALIFSQFIGGLDGLESQAAAKGLDYLRMDGRTPVAKRKEIVQAFQSGEGPPFFFISLKTGGVGLNLTRANYVFHLDPWWNPAVENQATDRAHRIGQKRSVFVQRLIMEHSIESRMMDLKERKADLFRQLVEEPGVKAARSGLSREDFEYLLEG